MEGGREILTPHYCFSKKMKRNKREKAIWPGAFSFKKKKEPRAYIWGVSSPARVLGTGGGTSGVMGASQQMVLSHMEGLPFLSKQACRGGLEKVVRMRQVDGVRRVGVVRMRYVDGVRRVASLQNSELRMHFKSVGANRTATDRFIDGG